MKIEKKLQDLFIKLVEQKSPEYALGILESLKATYFMVAWNKSKKNKGVDNDRE